MKKDLKIISKFHENHSKFLDKSLDFTKTIWLPCFKRQENKAKSLLSKRKKIDLNIRKDLSEEYMIDFIEEKSYIKLENTEKSIVIDQLDNDIFIKNDFFIGVVHLNLIQKLNFSLIYNVLIKKESWMIVDDI